MTFFEFLDTLPVFWRIVGLAMFTVVASSAIGGIISLNKLGDISRSLEKIAKSLEKERKS